MSEKNQNQINTNSKSQQNSFVNSKGWALVTGASAGFGAQIAKVLAKEGYSLLLCARRLERLETLAQEIKTEYGASSICLSFDVGDLKACEKALDSVSNQISNIQVLVNNAGLACGVDKVQDAKISDWDRMIDTNLKGLLYITRQVLPAMIKNNSGYIINIGSVAGRWNYPGGAVYSSTKFAVRAFSESLRMDLMGYKIRVTNIEPGMAETEFSEVRLQDKAQAKSVYAGMTPLSAQDIADTVLWCIQRPLHVNISELVIFPTDQVGVGPSYVNRKN